MADRPERASEVFGAAYAERGVELVAPVQDPGAPAKADAFEASAEQQPAKPAVDLADATGSNALFLLSMVAAGSPEADLIAPRGKLSPSLFSFDSTFREVYHCPAGHEPSGQHVSRPGSMSSTVRRGSKQMGCRVNLAILNKTRRSPQPGDIFVMRPPDGQYLFGRVISTEATIGPMRNCILIYVYRARSPDKTRIPELLREQLLVPPIMTNKLPWTKGYFEFVEHRPPGPMDVLPQHCFHDESRGWYFDERSNRLPGPIEPVGSWGLDSYRTIDDEISKALGIPLAPD